MAASRKAKKQAPARTKPAKARPKPKAKPKPRAHPKPAKPSRPPASFQLFATREPTPEQPGSYSLILSGPGYAWERVADPIAKKAGLLGKFRFDCEGGMFCAYGPDREPLAALQALLEPFLRDKEKFKAVEKAARLEGNT